MSLWVAAVQRSARLQAHAREFRAEPTATPIPTPRVRPRPGFSKAPPNTIPNPAPMDKQYDTQLILRQHLVASGSDRTSCCLSCSLIILSNTLAGGAYSRERKKEGETHWA